MSDASRELFLGVPGYSTNPTLINGDHDHLPLKVPFYFTMRQNLFHTIPDNVLALAAPIVAYWALSLFFHLLDVSGWTWLDQYRIHESVEVKSRNRATRSQVFCAVAFQHTFQTFLAYYWLSDGAPEISPSRCMMEMEAVGRTLMRLIRWAVGPDVANPFWALRGADVTHWLYWWVIPVAQLSFSMFVVDTWQYVVHRLMHSNKYFYKIHSVHHRLYVPYAFGASYSHPVEGFVLDCLGAVVAETVANFSVRQSIFLYTFTSMKAVDDHCGYSLPFDPFQMLSGNNADFHDIHHQTIGIKSNFSQPFFVHWDVMLGTRMTRQDIEGREQKLKLKTI